MEKRHLDPCDGLVTCRPQSLVHVHAPLMVEMCDDW